MLRFVVFVFNQHLKDEVQLLKLFSLKLCNACFETTSLQRVVSLLIMIINIILHSIYNGDKTI